METYAPFQLTLRMLIELCDAVIIRVSNGTAFDAACKPFCSGVGKHEDCTVERHTASNTSVKVGLYASCQVLFMHYLLEAVRRRTTNCCSVVVIVAVSRYPTNTPSKPNNDARLLQQLAVLRYAAAVHTLHSHGEVLQHNVE